MADATSRLTARRKTSHVSDFKRPKARELSARRVLLHLVLIAVALVMLFPFLWTISASLKGSQDVLATPPHLFSVPAHWDNYSAIFDTLPMWRFFFNSVVVSFATTFVQVLTCSLAAYAFARLMFPGRNAAFLLYLATLMVPAQVTLVPLFMFMRLLHLTNTYPALILPGATSAFGVFLLRQFFLTIPRELEEAAFLDGASHWTVFWRIVLPLSRPGLAALTIFAFMGSWNSFLWPLLVTTDQSLMTLPLGLSTLQGQYSTAWNQLMAGTVISVLPIIVVYLIAQRHFVEGLTLSGIKG
ncbi:MAG: carbohydrate ABC transporter permease [Chloroflexota bacterium]